MAARRSLLFGLAAVLVAASARADDYPQGLVREQLEQAGRGVEADVGKLKPGELLEVEYVGRPVLVYRRTSAEQRYLRRPADPSLADPSGENMQASIEAVFASSASLVWTRLLLVDQPALEAAPTRSKHDEFLVITGWSPATGCRLRLAPPAKRANRLAAFADSCGKAAFDAAGRSLRREGAPAAARYNLYIPPHRFAAPGRLVVGLEPGAAVPELGFSHAKRYRDDDATHNLIIAARYDDAAMVEAALSKGANVNAFRSEDGGPLDAAIIGSRMETVKLLIERGARPTGRSMRAAEFIGRREVWEMLETMARKEESR